MEQVRNIDRPTFATVFGRGCRRLPRSGAQVQDSHGASYTRGNSLRALALLTLFTLPASMPMTLGPSNARGPSITVWEARHFLAYTTYAHTPRVLNERA